MSSPPTSSHVSAAEERYPATDSPTAIPLTDTPLPRTDTTSPPSSPLSILLVASACVAPAMVLHYIFIRRNLRSVSDQLIAMKAAHEASLKRPIGMDSARYRFERHAVDMDSLRTELSRHKLAHGKKIGDIFAELKSLKVAVSNERQNRERILERLDTMDTDLQRFASQMKGPKVTPQEGAQNLNTFSNLDAATLEELGSSLADVAAFMQEVETLEGLEGRGADPRGIERLRQLAQKLHKLASSVPPKQEGKDDGKFPPWPKGFLWGSRGSTAKDHV